MNLKVILISGASVLLVLIGCIVFNVSKTVEIVEVGEIPKAFYNQTTDLSLKNTDKKENNIIDNSVISDKTIYLTFDDGPSYLTSQILDVLKAEKVAATFFMIGPSIYKYQDVVKRAHEEGHTVALHSNTHSYKYIYSSEDNYFRDLDEIKTKVYQITGVNARIIRLPGGSSNTVSKKYNQGIMTRITNKLNENGYYYFDWNIDSEDASGSLSADQIYQNTISKLHTGTNMILMHDAATKKTTAEALPRIISYAKENGYTFARITKNTESIHHHINN